MDNASRHSQIGPVYHARTVVSEGGLFFYQVSAKFGTNDANNPDGESLPSEPLTVQLPPIRGNVKLKLSWKPIPNAVGYFLYRTNVDQDFNSISLLTYVNGENGFIDDGSMTSTSVQKPLEQGVLVGCLSSLQYTIRHLTSPHTGKMAPDRHLAHWTLGTRHELCAQSFEHQGNSFDVESGFHE